ncbi:hypothetical protein SAMN05216223_12153 [Actinacidiphila yanglinensis]|uniref:Uncharacterized protein n=1 Tax=Actinacidiphila yanglinensis TaxID=310779 RepID=A0A1H6DYV4_9ACTN|nr:hypothetical protein [Actinacidiphila yanglinensis]SEG90003.1 hypothetical protein SAMN05216223_12153 [Actinacidiphila yanglinensis]
MHMQPWAVRTARAVVRERSSRIYLAAVAVCLVLTLVETAVAGDPAVSFPGVLLELATLPWTPVLWRLFVAAGGLDVQAAADGWSGWTLTLVAAAVSAALDALLIGWAVRTARRRALTSR